MEEDFPLGSPSFLEYSFISSRTRATHVITANLRAKKILQRTSRKKEKMLLNILDQRNNKIR